jgi:hypothetical protein
VNQQLHQATPRSMRCSKSRACQEQHSCRQTCFVITQSCCNHLRARSTVNAHHTSSPAAGSAMGGGVLLIRWWASLSAQAAAGLVLSACWGLPPLTPATATPFSTAAAAVATGEGCSWMSGCTLTSAAGAVAVVVGSAGVSAASAFTGASGSTPVDGLPVLEVGAAAAAGWGAAHGGAAGGAPSCLAAGESCAWDPLAAGLCALAVSGAVWCLVSGSCCCWDRLVGWLCGLGLLCSDCCCWESGCGGHSPHSCKETYNIAMQARMSNCAVPAAASCSMHYARGALR